MELLLKEMEELNVSPLTIDAEIQKLENELLDFIMRGGIQ